MAMEVAVFISESGHSASMYNATHLRVYQCQGDKWHINRQLPFQIETSLSLKEIRSLMAPVQDFLGSCRVIAGQGITGVACFELQKAGFSIWTTEGLPDEFLNDIREAEIKAEEQEGSNTSNPPAAEEISPGRYRISLIDVQKNQGTLTSKQVLLPILNRGRFDSLEIICDHVPPWLEEQVAAGMLQASIKPLDICTTLLTITKTTPTLPPSL